MALKVRQRQPLLLQKRTGILKYDLQSAILFDKMISEGRGDSYAGQSCNEAAK